FLSAKRAHRRTAFNQGATVRAHPMRSVVILLRRTECGKECFLQPFQLKPEFRRKSHSCCLLIPAAKSIIAQAHSGLSGNSVAVQRGSWPQPKADSSLRCAPLRMTCHPERSEGSAFLCAARRTWPIVLRSKHDFGCNRAGVILTFWTISFRGGSYDSWGPDRIEERCLLNRRRPHRVRGRSLLAG